MSIKTDQLADLIKGGLVPKGIETASATEIGQTYDRVRMLAQYKVAESELQELWEDAKAFESLKRLIDAEPLYVDIIKYLALGHALGVVVRMVKNRSTTNLPIDLMVAKVFSKLDYFQHEPYSATLSRLQGRLTK